MIQEKNNVFFLHTEHTTYAFRVMETGHLEHLYYGRRLKVTSENMEKLSEGMTEKHSFAPGNSVCYDQEHSEFSLEDVCLEMSSYGKGDIREPFIEVVHKDGSFTSDFLFSHFETGRGKTDFETLPGSYGENAEWIKVILKDAQYGLTLELNYYVYDACDVITRSVRLVNDSQEEITVKRLMSARWILTVQTMYFQPLMAHGQERWSEKIISSMVGKSAMLLTVELPQAEPILL